MRFALRSLAFCLAFTPAVTLACTCDSITREAAYQDADLVFFGKVEAVTSNSIETNAVFFIDNIWKGVASPSIELKTPTQSAACGQAFETGQTYLIYANQEDDAFVTTSCKGNKMNPGAKLLLSLGKSRLNYENRNDVSCPKTFPNAKNPETGQCLQFDSLCDLPKNWITTDLCKLGSGAFSDIDTSHTNYDAIRSLLQRGIINGFPDGSFKPDRRISRAAFVKIIIEANYSKSERDSCNKERYTFPDVPQQEWFAPHVCLAVEKGIISGYPDGTFQPEKHIGIAAAAKILTELYQLPKTAVTQNWYEPYIVALADHKVIPNTVTYIEQQVTRAEVAEMIWRIQEDVQDKTYTKSKALLTNSCANFTQAAIPNVDLDRVRVAWLQFYNQERQQAGLNVYSYNQYLHKTAYDWSAFSAERGYMDHKRPGQTQYYDYNIIKNWFEARGLVFKNRSRVTFTENIGWGPWRCNAADCTQQMIDSIRTTFDFYLAEKNDAYRPHYDSIFNPLFREIGLGIALSPEQDKYYLTVHFGTEITSKPKTLCTT